MDTRKNNREEWIAWLRDERHISEHVMIEAGLGIDTSNGELVIPVYGADGTFLFNKYRKSPWTRDGAKYRYETGSKASLFGAETLTKILSGETVLIAEGELDCLALRTLGYFAVSTTGGAGTWREEWSGLLSPFDVVFAYDADRAGVEGMLKASALTPNSSIAWIPVQYGKDNTEIIHAGKVDELREAIASASRWRFPHPTEENSKKLKQYIAIRKKLSEERTFVMSQPNMTPFHIDIAFTWVNNEIKKIREEENRPIVVNVNDEFTSDIESARRYPIKSLVKVGAGGFARCVAHTEKTGSLQVYKDNHAFCFGSCQKRFDAIDIYRAIHGCDFKTAVKALQS